MNPLAGNICPPPPSDLAFDAAVRWIGMHLGEHLARDRHLLVERGVSHMRHAFNLSHERAERIVLQALGHVEGRASPAYIDVARSTRHTVFLVDPLRNRTVVFTAQDLLDRIWSGKQQALAIHTDTGAMRRTA